MTISKSKLTGWILSILLALFLIGASAMGKFTEWEGKAQMFETKLGAIHLYKLRAIHLYKLAN